MTLKGFALLGSLLAIAGTVSAYPTGDEVKSLWQWTDISFGMYSGYTPIPNSKKSLHYVAALSQRSPTTDPVIIWFNGGPGCSSMLGLMQEHGPYMLPDGETQFVKNPYSWNKQANMIYIESPAGVGYSTCGDPAECKWDDFNTAEDNLQAVLGIMDKFPELQKNDLYISGESYAGIYVPRLVEQLDWFIGNCSTATPACTYVPNLKGFIVGNGVTDYRFDNPSMYIEMSFWYGLIATSTYEGLTANNCSQELDNPSPICLPFVYELGNATENINVYDAFGKCYTTPSQFGPVLQTTKLQQFFRTGNEITLNKRYFSAGDYSPFLAKRLVPPCVFAKPVLDYLNNATVRLQLNIPTTVGTWDLCNGDINKNYQKYPGGSIDVYVNLRHKYRVLKYSGDTDMAVPTYATKAWIENLNWPVSKQWKQYMVGTQVGGYVEIRDDGNFTFATIHGAGHMAPQWRPEFTYHTVFNWINGKPI